MSVSSQENQHHNFPVEQAINDGKSQAAELEQSELEIILEFTETQRNMIMELTSALTLSVEVLLETAISYVYYNYKKYQEFANKLEELSIAQKNIYEQAHKQIENSPKCRKTLTKKLILAAEISHKLEELGMAEKINECVATGIDMLYKKLTNDK
ncbi:hypothetical protein [Nostoc sp. UHCC 0252]|uniref:hypothetical protein n=1 Tax=Nostoc sp. UHCC 0252 TaxID=3110241 RepID=UPI002B215D44|nr:hypothetical protein [Nostoc sp. UHCC 0252]MEA5604900.1 hypothetical protein [Nostoc sp. UHCC 0252]